MGINHHNVLSTIFIINRNRENIYCPKVVEKGEKMSKKLYVGNLSYKTTEDDLKDLFKEFKTVTEVNVITDRTTGRSRGFGFVEFSSDEDADKAIESLNGKMFQDREIVINEARPRKNRGFQRY
jgi:RNA recognition motif-containing protein